MAPLPQESSLEWMQGGFDWIDLMTDRQEDAGLGFLLR